jgi:hypothetical protein
LALGIALGPGGALAFGLSGTVVDPTGAPVADVDLDLVDLATGVTLVTPHDNTDSHGDYSIDVPAGSYRILFEPSPALRLAPHIEPRIEVTDETVFDLTLAPGWSLAGRVTDPNGLGVAGVDLDVIDPALGVKLPNPEDQTNPLGFYTLIVPAGVYEVRATPPLASRLVPVQIDSVAVASVDVILNLHLQPGLVLSGTVRDRAGVGVADVDFDAFDLATGSNVFLGQDKTDAQGAFALVMAAGRYALGVDAPSATRLVSRKLPEVEVIADRTLDLTLEPGHLVSGTVLDPVAQPVEGANLDFLIAATGEAVPTPSDVSNLHGEYAVVLPTGTYDVVARPPRGADYPPDTTRVVSVTGDYQLDVRFGTVLKPGAVLALEPIFPNPTPAAATFRFEVAPGMSDPIEITIFDAQGRVVEVLEAAVDAGRRGTADWNGLSQRGFPAPSGVYIVRVRSGGHVAVQKLVIFRESLIP